MSANHKSLSKQDQNFILQAGRGGLAEVQLSQLAVERTSDDEVREFGQHMIEDHSQANHEIEELIVNKGASLATELDIEHRELLNKLSSQRGAEFDRAYINAMVKDHIKVLSEFELETTTGQDPDLKDWAKKMLPKLQNHLRMAQDLSKRH